MKQEIEGFHVNDAIEEPELEKEVQLLQSNLEETREGVESTQASISGLREAIKQQPCTHQEKLALLRQTEELKKDVQMKREKIERAREIKNKFDHKLTTEICKVLEKFPGSHRIVESTIFFCCRYSHSSSSGTALFSKSPSTNRI